jgi:hypothetical protein
MFYWGRLPNFTKMLMNGSVRLRKPTWKLKPSATNMMGLSIL